MDKTESLLKTFLPMSIVKELKIRQEMEIEETHEIADHFDCASVLFTDMKGFTKYCATIDPSELVLFLNKMYQKFDRITNRTEMYKVEIIGDVLLCFWSPQCPGPIMPQGRLQCA